MASVYVGRFGLDGIPCHQQIRNAPIVIAHMNILALLSYAHYNDIGTNCNGGRRRGVDQCDDSPIDTEASMSFEEKHEGFLLYAIYDHFAVVDVLLERPVKVIFDERIPLGSCIVLPCQNWDRSRFHPIGRVHARPKMQISGLCAGNAQVAIIRNASRSKAHVSSLPLVSEGRSRDC